MSILAANGTCPPRVRFEVQLIARGFDNVVISRTFSLQSYAEEQALIWTNRYPEHDVAVLPYAPVCEGCAS